MKTMFILASILLFMVYVHTAEYAAEVIPVPPAPLYK
jgi:hypothetical protein